MIPTNIAGGVLIVDDEPVGASMIANVFEQVGVRCVVAETVDAALRTLRDEPAIALAIVDYSVISDAPGASIARLRCDRPSLFIVGNSGEDRSLDFAALGVSRFLLKPWRLLDVLALLSAGGQDGSSAFPIEPER